MPLDQSFSYLPGSLELNQLQIGARIKVPFGSRRMIGVITELPSQLPVTDYPLKQALELIDSKPVIDHRLMKLAVWMSDYYLEPLGEVLSAMLPGLGETDLWLADTQDTQNYWILTPEAKAPDQRHHRLHDAYQAMLTPGFFSDAERLNLGISLATLRSLESKAIVKCTQSPPARGDLDPLISEATLPAKIGKPVVAGSEPMNPAQTAAFEAINSACGYQTFLLYGVTGSGKTRVYIELIRQTLAAGKQALVLLPEINLTPQTSDRFKLALPEANIQMVHSRMTPKQRAQSFARCLDGMAQLVLGTRSAVFAPLNQLGLIIIDESHDGSYKQQSGVRYEAQSVAMMRATQFDCPVVLGTATPSVDTLKLIDYDKITRLDLPDRAGLSKPPKISLLDVRGQFCPGGISQTATKQIQQTLKDGHQALVFLNRRGFAQVLLCLSCGWQAHCHRCEVALTLHREPASTLHCHHCGWHERPPLKCPECRSTNLSSQGVGTQQLEEHLRRELPGFTVLRIDSDSTRKKHSFGELLDQIHSGEPLVMIGTQMLAKGHHFDHLALVVVLGSDQSLFSSDFRAAERSAQLITQVAGRAGRTQLAGQVTIQTLKPDHPLLTTLTQQGYEPLIQQLKAERAELSLPPYAYSALVVAKGSALQDVLSTLTQVQNLLIQSTHNTDATFSFWGPTPSPVPRKNGRYSGFLWVLSHSRPALHEHLKLIKPKLGSLNKRVHVIIDVDPSGFE